MHAYLITGHNQDLVQQQIRGLIAKLKCKRLDFILQKIADVRGLGKFTNLALNEKTAMVIEDFDEAGEEAQNAFLKNLEEPQENLIYILTATNEDAVLPTIASRCQHVEITNHKSQITNETQDGILKFLNSSVGEKLQTTSKITKREDAVQFIKDIIMYLQDRLVNDHSLVHSIEVADQTLRNLEQNGSVQIQLTNFAVNA